MSGMIGILRLDGAPVDRRRLLRLTASLRYRGPDALEVWSEGPVGFGHAMLRTTRDAERERQPASLDGEVWITADVRVDGRRELIEKLGSKGRRELQAASDAELVLHAYHAWGEQCVEHLLGDFAFAIWDGRSRRLFCARDHFGVKPFYYAQLADSLVFSNTLNCVRLHPGISDELNELAVADFLLFDFNQDPAATTFADIHRLPPAHTLTWSPGALQIRRYWSLPIEAPIEHRRASDYVDQFRELLRVAVEDRLRTERVAVSMSGGLDSTSVAGAAKRFVPKQSVPFELRAYTVVYDRLIPDEERYYTRWVAEALDIPVEFMAADDYALYERWDRPELRTPEPIHNPLVAIAVDQFQWVAARHRVLLTGYGGDPAFSTSLSRYAARLARGWQLARLASDLGRYMLGEGRMSRLYVRTRLRILLGRNRWGREMYPPWLNADLAKRLDLPARWEQINTSRAPDHPFRPTAYQALMAQDWPCLFEGCDPGTTGVPLESRYPFFDLRLVRYLLRLSSLPWCADKELLRASMRGILPESVRLRRKSPLAACPFVARARRGDAGWRTQLAPAPQLSKYVDWSRVPGVTGKEDTNELWLKLRPVSFNFWLLGESSARYKPASAASDEIASLASEENGRTEAARD
jgi:asparagine synthase (glutamine-hydrolysing)